MNEKKGKLYLYAIEEIFGIALEENKGEQEGNEYKRKWKKIEKVGAATLHVHASAYITSPAVQSLCIRFMYN